MLKSTVGEFGIACESCHGPGEAHIAWTKSQTGETPYSALPMGPGHQSQELDVCGPCHARREAFSQVQPKAGGILPFFSLDPSPGGYVWHNLVFPRSQIAVGPFPTGGGWNGDWNGSLWTLFYEWACYLMAAGLGLAGLLTRGRALGTAAIAALRAGDHHARLR